MTNPDRLTSLSGRLVRRSAYGMLGVALVGAALTGCKKEEPPPPPPRVERAPAPPPPAEFDLATLVQEMDADARVQFAPGVTLTVEDEDLARAIVELADALARGDSSDMSGLLTNEARAVLEMLQNTGEWSDATADIEAVRVIYVDPADFAEQTKVDAEELLQAMSDEDTEALTEMLSGLSPQAQVAVMQAVSELVWDGMDFQAMVAAAMSGDMAALEGMAEDSTDKLDDFLDEGDMTEMQAALDEALIDAGSVRSGRGVLIAVQDPGGAYLLGWTAEGSESNPVFANETTMGGTRARAEAWDVVGSGGFGTGGDAFAAAGANLIPANLPGAPDEEAEEEEPGSGKAPRKKNTPHGPVTIPGS